MYGIKIKTVKKMNEKKCGKYEELFISSDEAALLEHIKNCPECAEEHKRMQKVSNLVKEVSFIYKKRAQKRPKIVVFSMAASFLMIFLAFFAIQITTPSSFVNETIAYISDGAYGIEYSYEDMGLPVDEYGLIMVDTGNEF